MQRLILKSRAFHLVIMAALFMVLPSFVSKPGGEGFEIYLNNKLVVESFGSKMNTVQTLQLDQANYNDQLTVKYHHCGKVGKSRQITIRDGQDRLLKEWKFADASQPYAPMTCKIKDILDLKKGKSSTLKLYYSSTELPKGRLLASINTSTAVTASVR